MIYSLFSQHLHCHDDHHEDSYCAPNHGSLGALFMLLATAAATHYDEVDGHEDEDAQNYDDRDAYPNNDSLVVEKGND